MAIKALLASALLCGLSGSTPTSAGAQIRTEAIQLEKDQPSTTITGEIQGDQIVDHLLRGRVGQSMTARLEPSNPSAYFNVLPPGSDTAIFVGSITGNRFESELPADGLYTIRVYLMRSAARRNETAKYTLAVSLAGGGETRSEAAGTTPAARARFDRTLELQGIRFRVTCQNEGSLNTLRIAPEGLEIDDSPIVRPVEGTVTGAEVADLNVDGSPEIYVYLTSAGSGSYGSLVAYSANRRKSLSEIYLPPISGDAAASKGYQGHDAFAVVESVLVRRFPIYRDADSNAEPSGGTRQLQYRLAPGEAGWILRVDRTVEY